jgi:RNA polymerase sigma factor (sigma-70 family)
MEDERARTPVQSPASESPAAAYLREFIATHFPVLMQSLQIKVWYSGIPCEISVRETALEVLNEVTQEALDHAARFDVSRSPLPWLLGIGVHVILRRKAAVARRRSNEQSAHQSRISDSDQRQDSIIFDEMLALASPSPEAEVIDRDQVERLLAPLSEDDRRIVRLACLLDLDFASIAAVLGITPNAARVRLHRALQRLRRARGTDGSERDTEV